MHQLKQIQFAFFKVHFKCIYKWLECCTPYSRHLQPTEVAKNTENVGGRLQNMVQIQLHKEV